MTGPGPLPDLFWHRCTPELQSVMEDTGLRPYRECAEAPTLPFGDEPGTHLHGVPMAVSAALDQRLAERPAAGPSLAEAQLAVAAAGLARLALDEPVTDLGPGNRAYGALAAEMSARREHAAGTLETITRLAAEEPERESRGGNPVAPEPVMELLESARALLQVAEDGEGSSQRWRVANRAWLGRYRALVAEYAAAAKGESAPEPEQPPARPSEYEQHAVRLRIRDERERAAMSQAALAEAVGVTQTAVA
jgi:hypothetical protein